MIAATNLVGTIQAPCRRRYRSAFLQCSFVIVSTILTPASGFWCSSGFAPLTQHQQRQVQWPSSKQQQQRLFSNCNGRQRKRRYRSGTSVWNHHRAMQHFNALQSYTQLSMSTSTPPGEFDVSESVLWDNGVGDDSDADYENENDNDNQDDNDFNNDENDDESDSASNLLLLEEQGKWTKAVEKAVTALGKKRRSLESELAKAEGAEGTAAHAQLLVSNLYLFKDGVKKATVNDWENDGKEVELELDTSGKYSSPSEEADALFALVRKLKRGSKIVATLLKETDDAWEIFNDAKLDLKSSLSGDVVDEGRLAIVKERLIRSARTTKFKVPSATNDDGNNSNGSSKSNSNSKYKRDKKPELGTPASNVRKMMSPGGCIVMVGRNRRGNEYLSMTVARGNDIWMHSRGCPGAHVIIQNRRGSPKVTDDCIQFGADLAIFYSDLRNELKAEVTAAEPKHVQKPRGAPLGAVKLREEWKTFVGFPDNVPEELKDARERSGQTDEYHMVDKAKHRRKTKKVVEEDRAKKKQKQREKKNQK